MPGQVLQGVFRRVNGSAFQLPRHQSAMHEAGGQPLPAEVRQRMESFFRTSFAGVRVHVGHHAPAIGALAFTQGSHIHFAPGQYDPSSPRGLQMLGHELAHVVQQRTGRVRNPFGAGVAVVTDRGLEAEADRLGQLAAAHQPRGSAVSVQRMAAPSAAIQRTKIKRPEFMSGAKNAARLHQTLFGGFRVGKGLNLTTINAAMPHRMSWKDIRDNTLRFVRGTDDADDFERWTDRFLRAGAEKARELKPRFPSRLTREQRDGRNELRQWYRTNADAFETARDALMAAPGDRDKLIAFLRIANSFFGNVPDLGPHRGVNNPVRERGHLNVRTVERGRSRVRELSPMSRRVADMSPGRISGIAVDDQGDLITVRGESVRLAALDRADQRRIRRHPAVTIRSYDPNAEFG